MSDLIMLQSSNKTPERSSEENPLQVIAIPATWWRWTTIGRHFWCSTAPADTTSRSNMSMSNVSASSRGGTRIRNNSQYTNIRSLTDGEQDLGWQYLTEPRLPKKTNRWFLIRLYMPYWSRENTMVRHVTQKSTHFVTPLTHHGYN